MPVTDAVKAVLLKHWEAALDRSGLGDLRIDTDGLSVGEAADLVGRRW